MAEPHHVADLLDKTVHAAPFLVGVAQKPPRLSGARIIEAVIIAVVVGGLSLAYNTLHVIPQIRMEQQHARFDTQKDIAYIRESMTELRQEVRELKGKVDFINVTRK